MAFVLPASKNTIHLPICFAIYLLQLLYDRVVNIENVVIFICQKWQWFEFQSDI